MIGTTRLTISAALVAVTVVLPGWSAALGGEADYAAERAAMVETIERYAQFTGEIVGAGGLSPPVLDAMRRVERHLFVPDQRRAVAYLDRPVPIGFGQTISQPFIVALMTDLLDVEADDVVLEIGTGSGYQAACCRRWWRGSARSRSSPNWERRRPSA